MVKYNVRPFDFFYEIQVNVIASVAPQHFVQFNVFQFPEKYLPAFYPQFSTNHETLIFLLVELTLVTKVLSNLLTINK